MTRHVPRGCAAYVPICHPVDDNAGRQVTWSAVAAATGRQAHPTMQWHALVGSADALNVSGSLWAGTNPERGTLAAPELATLCAMLAQHTCDPELCYFCLWDGWGWLPHGLPAQVHHDDRDYCLLTEMMLMSTSRPGSDPATD